MDERRDLLIEIGTEELPPKALHRLSGAFTDGIAKGLQEAGLAHDGLTPYATPRRLAVLVGQLATAQADRINERRGPALAAAFDKDGAPTKAAEGFARSCGVTVDALQTVETDKGSWLVHRSEQQGAQTASLIPAIVEQSLAGLPIPKRMRWGDGDAEFVRPVHWVALLFGHETIEAQILGVASGRESRGHRFHHDGRPIVMSEPTAYAAALENEGRVIADFAARRETIRKQVQQAVSPTGGTAVIDEALLEEVTAMVEWPVAVLGNFDQRFLDIPAEALVSAMKQHQKYFHVVDENGALLPHFVTVSNIASSDMDVVRSGNERVIRPRLSDAEFFWQQDRKQTLAARTEILDRIVFHHRLGSLHAKILRIARLAETVAAGTGGDTALAARAAMICKCDLLTEMVGEFPELQGVMGRYYAAHDGEPEAVGVAIDEHYMPRFAGDALPATSTGQALAIADKLDTIVGIFGVQELPTGTKDPFALRRAAIGVLRIMIERELDQLSLPELVDAAVAAYGAQEPMPFEPGGVEETVYDFMMERLRAYYSDIGVGHDVFESVASLRPARPYDFDRRIRAVNAFRALPEAESLTAANKRCQNLLRQAQGADIEVPDEVDAAKLVDASERSLAGALDTMHAEITPLLEHFDYEAALQRLAGLREVVDRFFDDVMVMVDDTSLRDNRLALLHNLRKLFLEVADVSCLQG